MYFPRGTNALSGGATLGAYGAAAMVLSDDVPFVDKQAGLLPDDFVVYRNARAVKSWFLFDDEIVALVAGVGDPAGRPVVTTVDSRIAAPADDVVVTGHRWRGGGWSGAGTGELRWVRYANRTQGTAVGYVFLDRQRVTVGLAPVTRSRRVVRAANPDTAVTKNVFDVTVAHGGDSLAYALVPGARESRLRDCPVTVLANDRHVQAVRHTGLGITAATVFASGWQRAGHLAVRGPASVLVREERDTLTVAVADPTMDRTEVSVVVKVRGMPTEYDDGVTVRRVPGGMMLTANTNQAYGRTFTARWRR